MQPKDRKKQSKFFAPATPQPQKAMSEAARQLQPFKDLLNKLRETTP